MFKSRKPPRKYHRFTWILGFAGFWGLRYFYSQDVNDLFFLSFLSFFSTYFTARLAAEMPDERYEENRLKARAATMFIPAFILFAIGIGTARGFLSHEWVVLLAAVGWAATFITYAVAFWYYEKH
jgi:Kef-type K+ transport system membrane component KefB